MNNLQQIWNNWYFQDALVGALLIVLYLLGRGLARREYWRSAFARVFERRSIRVSFAILCLYTLIAVLDSVGFHPVLRNDGGEPLRHPETGKVLYDDAGLSVLDWMLTALRENVEKTYSAPLATHQFSKETMITAAGEKIQDYPALKYPRRHLLGTDRVGNDVLYLAIKGVRTGMVIGAFTTLLVIPFATPCSPRSRRSC